MNYIFGFYFLFLAGTSHAIPIPPDQLLSWLVPADCPTSDCPNINIPVCGTNHVTYTNECFFKKDKCNSDEDLSIVKYGVC